MEKEKASCFAAEQLEEDALVILETLDAKNKKKLTACDPKLCFCCGVKLKERIKEKRAADSRIKFKEAKEQNVEPKQCNK